MNNDNFIKSSVERIVEKDPYKMIELAGRTCYKSEDKITDDSAKKFVNNIIKNKHLAMAEHCVFCFVYYNKCKFDLDRVYDAYYDLSEYANITKNDNEKRIIITANLRVMIENNYFNSDNNLDCIKSVLNNEHSFYGFKLVDFDDIENKSFEEYLKHKYYSFRIVTNRGVTHELVRHRKYSFAQESTRYVKYGVKQNLKFVLPSTFDSWDADSKQTYNEFYDYIKKTYDKLLNNGLSPQEARCVLPITTKTEIVVTGNLEEYVHFLTLRCAKAAHPDIRVIANLIKQDILDDIKNDKTCDNKLRDTISNI